MNDCADPESSTDDIPTEVIVGIAVACIVIIAWIWCMAFLYFNEKEMEEGSSEKGMYVIVSSVYMRMYI